MIITNGCLKKKHAVLKIEVNQTVTTSTGELDMHLMMLPIFSKMNNFGSNTTLKLGILQLKMASN